MQSSTSFIIRRIKAKEKSQTKWKKDADDAAAVVVAFAAVKDSHLIQMNFIFNSDFSLSCFVRLSVNYDWAEDDAHQIAVCCADPAPIYPHLLATSRTTVSCALLFPDSQLQFRDPTSESHAVTHLLIQSVSQSVRLSRFRKASSWA